ncbi:DUF342 domain-containing protein, partial [Campylobacter jejuni]|nr:DUF342 domain-containing protein [Campylobacter jejuni]
IERINWGNNKFHAKIKTLDKNYDEEFAILGEQISKLNHKINKIRQYILSSNGILSVEKKITELKNQGQNVPVQY